MQGTENVPKTGAVLIAPNHRSLADPPLVGSCAPRMLHFMAKEELFRFRPFGALISALNAHPLKRSTDVAAFKLAVRLLKQGHAIIVFPEGRRSKTEQFGPAKSGVGLLSKMVGCPVVPVYVHNSGTLSKFNKLQVIFGKPLFPDQYENAEEMAKAVMEKIAAIKAAFVA